jgi:beta-xylosidase
MQRSILIFLLAISNNLFAQKTNSFTPGEIWKDNNGVHINAHGGGLLFHKGKYYWFGEHKVAGELGNTAQVGVHCYSSKDLYNWTDEGIALKVSDDKQSDIAKGCILERPKVVYNKATKKFVMWFHLELLGKGYYAARSGVATADKITGPYTFIKSYRPNAKQMPLPISDTYKGQALNLEKPANKFDGYFARDFNGGQMARDMTVYVDDDGKAYHIFASEENFTLHVAELSADYTSHTGKFTRVYVGESTEAPAIFKKDDTYYMIGSGCTGWAPNPARWFKSKSILGPWQFMGNPAKGDKANITYGGQSTYVVKVKDQYIFLGDLWNPKNAIDGRYLWLPINFDEKGDIGIEYLKSWSLNK